MTQLWQGETDKAIENFPISGERVPVEVAMLARIKAEAARVNADLGLLDPGQAEWIAAAAEAVAAGEHGRPVPDRRVPDRVRHQHQHQRQRGRGQPGRGGAPPQRPRQHGPVLQRHLPDRRPPGRPSAAATNDPPPALDLLAGRWRPSRPSWVRDVVGLKADPPDGRRPGDPRPGVRRLRRPGAGGCGPGRRRAGPGAQGALGGTAVGNGLNAHPEFAARVRQRVAAAIGLEPSPPAHLFEAQGARDALVELSGASRRWP